MVKWLSWWLRGKESACYVGDRGLIFPGEDPLEKEMATHSSILAWEIPWTKEPGGLQSMRSQRVNTTEHTHTQATTSKQRLIKIMYFL